MSHFTLTTGASVGTTSISNIFLDEYMPGANGEYVKVYLYLLRSLGDSKTPVYFLVLSSVINIALDFILILYVKMGVAGAGVATVVSQLIAGVGCTIYMYKKFDILKGTKQEKVISKKHISNLCFIGVPMGLQYSITAIGSVILQTSVNTLGSVSVAAMTAGSKLQMFFACPFDALGSTMATYGGQNAGAKEVDRIGAGIRAAVIVGSVYSIAALVVQYLFGSYIALLFVDASETQVIAMTHTFLIVNALFFIPLALVNIIRFCIQGMGFAGFAVLAGVFEMVARTVVAFTLVPVFRFNGACMANPCAWVAADIFLIPAFIYCSRRLKKRFGIG